MRNLHDQALRLLESPLGYPGLPDHPRVRVLLRVWRYPSFQPYASWTLVQAREVVFLRRITWDQRHPLADTPVTFGAEVVIQAQAYEPLLSTLRSIQLPPFIPTNAGGIDGTTYGVELRNDVGSLASRGGKPRPRNGLSWAAGTQMRSPRLRRCFPRARPASGANRRTRRGMTTSGPSASTRAAPFAFR